MYIYIYIHIHTLLVGIHCCRYITFCEPGFGFLSVCRQLWRFSETVIFPCKCTNIIEEICGDDESAQQLRRTYQNPGS